MKNIPALFEKWEIGDHSGQNRSHGRVTVEPDWVLGLSPTNVGTSKKGPFRWYQRADNSQVELEIPNVKSIQIDRTIDADAATCNIAIYNNNINYDLPAGYLPPTELGTPGFYSWNRGQSEEARERWGQVINDFSEVLIPNALLRTYQGYGGYNSDGSQKDIDVCIGEGSLTLTGVWMIDSVAVNTSGQLSIKCRDMAKLLLDQQIFLPFIPQSEYPLNYHRWTFTDIADNGFAPRKPIIIGSVTGGVTERPLTYFDSSADRWFGSNASIEGHRGTDSVDGNTDTFALSVGNSHPSRPFCTDWFEYTVNGQMNQFYMHPWGGNYHMYVSIMENGVWQDGGWGLIPYDPSSLGATQAYVDTGGNIPFIYNCGTPWESGQWYNLPRIYNVERIRITFRDHTQSPWGPWFYRCGIREIRAKIDTTIDNRQEVIPLPWCYDIESDTNPSDPSVDGYWVVDDTGVVFAYGDARKSHTVNSSNPAVGNVPLGTDRTVVAIRNHPSGGNYGYWTLQIDGRVKALGNCYHFGDSGGGDHDYIDMAPTNSGNGYYLVQRNGVIHNFGDAVHYGNMPTDLGVTNIPASSYTATAMETHPTLDGYWIVDGDGRVRAFGDLPFYGEVLDRGTTPGAGPNGGPAEGLIGSPGSTDGQYEYVCDITRNEAGDGYWLLAGAAHVFAFGACEHFGTIPLPHYKPNDYSGYRDITWAMAPANHGTGYLILQADGRISAFGSAHNWGYPGGVGQQRSDGNYKDYVDIVRDLLLWSGFWFYKADPPSGVVPEVYGNLESTGAYADDGPPADMFDKHPPIDAIHKLKEVVGYIFYIDDEGAARFESPNWWSIGNMYNDGTRTDFIPEIDENSVITSYSAEYSDTSARSEIIMSSNSPDSMTGNYVTKTTRYIPETANLLRGMIKPAMWVNGYFTNMKEQRIMAELIGLHIWFQLRIGSVETTANPCIQIGDQVRISERQTAETYIHFIRGISTNHDLDTGQYTSTLTTNWLGDEDNWVITRDNIPTADTYNFNGIKVSDELLQWLDTITDHLNTTSMRLDQEPSITRSPRTVHTNSVEIPTTMTSDSIIGDGAPGGGHV